MKIIFSTAIVMAVVAAGCTKDEACGELPGMSFRSVQEHECGLGPDGPAKCNWSISFSKKAPGGLQFAWEHSDFGDSGPVQCEEGALTTGTLIGGAAPITGTYDPETGTLIWDRIEYQPSPQ